MTKEEIYAAFMQVYTKFVETAKESCKGDEDITQDKIETCALVMTMSALYEQRIGPLEEEVKRLVEAVGEVGLAVENLALQTTNNHVEDKKILDSIKMGILD